MFSVEDILARIQKGESVDDIATEFTKSINAALEIDKEQKAREAALQKEAEEKAAQEAKMDDCVRRVVETMIEYISIKDPDLADMLKSEEVFDVAEIRKTLDLAINTAKMALAFADAIPDAPAKPHKILAPKTVSADDAINQFLKNFGL